MEPVEEQVLGYEEEQPRHGKARQEYVEDNLLQREAVPGKSKRGQGRDGQGRFLGQRRWDQVKVLGCRGSAQRLVKGDEGVARRVSHSGR